jgi:hydroxyacylglutathione hydrolase
MLKEVVPGVFFVESTRGSNVYLVGEEHTALVDAGFPMDAKRIMRQLRNKREGFPSLLIATHYHIDHVGSLKTLKEAFGATVAAHRADADVMEWKVPYQRFKVDMLRTIYYGALAPLFRYEKVSVEEKLCDGAILDVFGGLEVIHVPGHTEGSIMLHQKEKGMLFSGDTLRNENGVLQGPPPEFSPGIDEAFWHIKEKILNLDFDVLLPGHGVAVLGNARAKVEQMLRASNRLE